MFETLSHSLSHIFSKVTKRNRIDAETIRTTLDQVVDALLQADVPYDVAYAFRHQLAQEVEQQERTKGVNDAEQLMHVVHTQLSAFLGSQTEHGKLPDRGCIMMMGLQGSGKTTTAVKLARQLMYHAQQANVLVGSVDFDRPAAVDQLHTYAEQAGVATYRAQATDPIAAAQEIVAYSKSHAYQYVIVDTAGRLHIDDAMLAQLPEIQKQIKPAYRALVLDAMMGQSSLEVARTFKERIGFDGGILTKMDSDTRGGAAFAFTYMLAAPIIYAGSGEKIDDLESFQPDRVARRMLDMGDLLTLSEKAQEKIDEAEAQHAQERMEKGELTLEDFAQQLRMMQRLGSLSSIMQYVPGASSMQMSQEHMQQAESELARFRVMMNAMTPKERTKPKIINRSRKERIARGSGVSVREVTQLLERFEQSRKMMKMMKDMGGLQQLFQ